MADSKPVTEGSSSESTDRKTKKSDYEYERRVSRISKENVFMVLAVWMERSPLAVATANTDNIVGAVLVAEENRLYLDCTRDGVHAMARLLTKHSQKLKGSTIYTSRRPCSFCAKLLVQCGVSKLYYLPTEPEKRNDDEDLHRVDNLLKVARLGHSYFVPHVDEKVVQETKKKAEKIRTHETSKLISKLEGDLMDLYWKEGWMNEAAKKLHWNACDDKMLPQFKEDFKKIMQWISQVTVIVRHSDGYSQYPQRPPTPKALSDEEKSLYDHLLQMAQILAQRTDDPRTGVGAVIWKENEIVATGWNGFPAKALYGEFPRASDKDEAAREEQKKYPYVIHAEQNALLMRNTGDVSGSTLFVTKVPCQECVPLLKLEKVNKCVVGINEQQARKEFGRKGDSKNLRYDVFPKEVEDGNFTCFVLREAKPPAVRKARLSSAAKRRQQDPSTEQSANSKKKKQ